MKFWFTSDHHFGHGNIIQYCNRPFDSVGQMDFELVRRWNETVSDGDVVLHFGDFCLPKRDKNFLYYRQQLAGDIIFLHGSHDSKKEIRSIVYSCTVRHGGHSFYCSHEPKAEKTYNLCGHVHEKWKIQKIDDKKILNVGVDQWDFYPIDIDQILVAFCNEQ